MDLNMRVHKQMSVLISVMAAHSALVSAASESIFHPSQREVCFVDGNKLVFEYDETEIPKDGLQREVEQKCHSALIREMREVCGSDRYKAKDADSVQCLVHGTKKDYDWQLPSKDSSIFLWTAAVIDGFEDSFTFGWAFAYSLPGILFDWEPWIGIFTIDNPDKCAYLKREGEQQSMELKETDKGVFRVKFRDNPSWPPDARIHSPKAAHKCGLRLLKKLTLTPIQPGWIQRQSEACFVDGNRVVFQWDENSEDNTEVEKRCHSALIREMKEVCGSDKYKAKDADSVECVVSGHYRDFDWWLPSEDSSHVLSTVAFLRGHESQFSFNRPLSASMIGFFNEYQPWIGVFSVDNPGQCAYVTQRGGIDLTVEVEDQAVQRVPDQQASPQAWDYPARAARKCGLRLLKKLLLTPHSRI